MRTTVTSDLVLLVPGFFGFDRIGSFYYFGDRVSAALRGHLEGELSRSVPVIALALGPAEGLRVRQRTLLDAAAQLLPSFPDLARIHLVGHSSGGVDAELLLADRALDGSAWSRPAQAIRERIATVTTIAAPHYGTTLALADVTRLVERPITNLGRLGALLPAAMAVAATLPDRVTAKSQLLGDVGSLQAFLRQFWRSRELLRDLVPERMEALRRERPRDAALGHVPVHCYATCAIANPSPTHERFESPDPLFLYLVNHTAGAHVDRLAPEIRDNLRALNAAGVPTIASPSKLPRPLHTFDAVDNDAVVNTARQLLPHSKLAAIVHADHADVLGHYDRKDPLRPSRFIKEGVFRSGARFDDDEFFALYRSVAWNMVKVIHRLAGSERGAAVTQSSVTADPGAVSLGTQH